MQVVAQAAAPRIQPTQPFGEAHVQTNKTKTALNLASLAILAALCSSASAQDGSTYMGLSAGRSAATIDDARIKSGLLGLGFGTSSISDRDRDGAWKLYGGYRFNQWFALEGGYFDLGKFGYTATTVPAGTLRGDIRVKGLNLDVVGTYPLTPQFSVFGRLGATHSRTEGAFSGTGAVVTASQTRASSTDAHVGLGFGYAFNNSWAMRLEGERQRIDDSVGNKGHIDLFSIGVVYTFGQPRP
jgi:OOP family OmpA-OmpF porin